MKDENHKLAVICRQVGVNPNAVYEIFRRIRRAVMEEGGEVITHELGTFYRAEFKSTSKKLNEITYLVPERTCLALRGVKGPGIEQMEEDDICNTNKLQLGVVSPGVVLGSVTRFGRIEVMPGTRLVVTHVVREPDNPSPIESETRLVNSTWITEFNSDGLEDPFSISMEVSNDTPLGVVNRYSFDDKIPSGDDLIELEILFLERASGSNWNVVISVILNGESVLSSNRTISRCNIALTLTAINRPLSLGGGERSTNAVPSILQANVQQF